jgi:hypothetical protein
LSPPCGDYKHQFKKKKKIEDKLGILLAPSHHDRVHRIYLVMPRTNVGKFIRVMDDQFPILECMYIYSRIDAVLPVTFQAPNLCHLTLWTTAPLQAIWLPGFRSCPSWRGWTLYLNLLLPTMKSKGSCARPRALSHFLIYAGFSSKVRSHIHIWRVLLLG